MLKSNITTFQKKLQMTGIIILGHAAHPCTVQNWKQIQTDELPGSPASTATDKRIKTQASEGGDVQQGSVQLSPYNDPTLQPVSCFKLKTWKAKIQKDYFQNIGSFPWVENYTLNFSELKSLFPDRQSEGLWTQTCCTDQHPTSGFVSFAVIITSTYRSS